MYKEVQGYFADGVSTVLMKDGDKHADHIAQSSR